MQNTCAREATAIPDDPRAQLRGAIEAVFRSSRSERARVYCEREGLGEDMPTAVVVQAMAFGNLGSSSGTGVAFSRNPSTGANETYGDFLANAQGEDVVAGIRASLPLVAMPRELARQKVHDELSDVLRRLEGSTTATSAMSNSQCRSGGCRFCRSGPASARRSPRRWIAIDPRQRGPDLSETRPCAEITPDQLRQLKSAARV